VAWNINVKENAQVNSTDYKCHICQQPYPSAKDRSNHLRQCKTVQFKFCDIIWKRKSGFLECLPHCDAKIRNERTFRSHIKQAHPDLEPHNAAAADEQEEPYQEGQADDPMEITEPTLVPITANDC
jgi:hypothetical protein